MKKGITTILKGIVIFIISIVALVILFLIACPIINNITAVNVMNDIRSIPLPEDTEIVETFSRAEKLVGNGNGMQYLGIILIQSDLSLDELDQYYSAYRENQWNYIVEEQVTQELGIIEYGSFLFNTDVSDGHFYIVYSWGDGLPLLRDIDLRGH